MEEYRLIIREVHHQCLDSQGEWDRTWDTSYEWVIENSYGIIERHKGGYWTREEAKKEGEEIFKKFLNK